MKRNMDVYFIVDRSRPVSDYLESLNIFFPSLIDNMRVLGNLDDYNVYINFLTFGGNFSKKNNVIALDKLLLHFEADKIKITPSRGSADPEAVLRTAVSRGVARYDEWYLQGIEATAPIYFFFSDGHFQADDRNNNLKQKSILCRYAHAASMVRDYVAEKKIRFYVCAIDTHRKTANMENLNLLMDDPESQLIEIFSDFIYNACYNILEVF